MGERLTWYERPTLKKPVMLVGFTGWLDGGEASTGPVDYLVQKLSTRRLAEISMRDFAAYQLPGMEFLRPNVETEDGLIVEVRYPTSLFHYWHSENVDMPHDLVLLRGTEPNLQWEEYTDIVLSVAEQSGVERLYSVGGVLDTSPHTREPLVSCSVSDLKLKAELAPYAVSYSNYKGPSTFNSALIAACRHKGLEAIHLTGRSTYYPEFNISIPHNSKVIYALLRRLNRLIGLGLDLSDLDQAGRELQAKLDGIVARNLKLKRYVEELEKNFVEVRYHEPIEGEPEDFVRDAEEFLRRQRDNGQG
ncbi:MAG: PAC2 family protein [Bacteroidetes bacterium]|nr:PAC2 family protein [Bacteroidota bacterium]MCL5025178.1 PAC2 family protein [Chloroflexota bacterium]